MSKNNIEFNNNSDVKLCSFCDTPLEKYNEYYVCPNCKTVEFSDQQISSKRRAKLINTFLKKTFNKILDQQEYQHSLEQRYMSKEELSETELEIRNTIVEFNDVYSSLELCYMKYIPYSEQYLNYIGFRKLLYRLLMISDWLKKYLGLED